MAKRVQLRRGTTTEHNTFTGAVGEVTVDTTNKTLRVHDGSTVGGTPLLKANQLVDSTTTVKGVVRLATESDITNSSETAVVTPKKLRNALNATGAAPISACRAWVVFTCVSNVVTILNSMNILSVTRLGTSNFKITYATPMPTANNVPLASGQAEVGSNGQYAMPPAIRNILAESCEVYHHSPSADFPLVTLGVFC